MRRHYFGIVLFLTGFTFIGTAQEARLFKPTLNLDYTLFPSGKLSDSVGTYSNQISQVKFVLPIYNHLSAGDSTKKMTYFQLMAHGGASLSNPELTSILERENLYGFSAGLTAFLVKGRKNIFSVSLNSMSRNDAGSFSHPKIRYSGIAQYRRNVSRRFSFHAGVLYSYLVGRGILLPAVGVQYKTGKHSRLVINFPSKISFIQNLGNKVRLTAYYRPQGGFYLISNGNEQNQLPTEYYLRERERHIGIDGLIKLTKNFSLTTDVGFAASRKISLNANLEKKSQTYFKSDISNGVYFGLGVKYIFRSLKKDKESEIISKEAEKEEILSDPDFYDLISE